MDEHREYDVIDFNVAFTPSRHAQAVTFNMEDEDRQCFERIIHDRVLPYSKIDHVIRHAIIRHREYVLRLMPIQKNGRSKYATWSEIRMQRQQLLEETNYGLVLDLITPVIVRLSGQKELNVAALIVEALLSRIFNMRSPRFREIYLREIEQKWTWILKATNRQDALPRRFSLVRTPSSES